MSGLLQSSHINVPWVIFASFMLTLAISVAITVLNSICVRLLHTSTFVIVVVRCRYRAEPQPLNAMAMADTATTNPDLTRFFILIPRALENISGYQCQPDSQLFVSPEDAVFWVRFVGLLSLACAVLSSVASRWKICSVLSSAEWA